MFSRPLPPRRSEWLASTELPTWHGLFAMHVFRATGSDEAQGVQEHVAMEYGDVGSQPSLPADVQIERSYPVIG